MISIVVPVFNEQESIDPFIQRMKNVLETLHESYEIIFALDPSTDSTEEIIKKFCLQDSTIKLIKFSRRFGQPAATMAGLRYSKGDVVVVIDVDLQDPPEVVLSLYKKLEQGFDVVFATRASRSGENPIRVLVARLAYKLIDAISPLSIPKNTGDFRIMRRKVVDVLCKLEEKNAFLRGLVAYVGFKQTAVIYNRDARYGGSTKYNRFLGSIRIGLNGIIGFSSKPLTIMTFVGFLIAFFSFVIGSVYLLSAIFGVRYSAGLPTLVTLITFLSGVQIMSLGIVGEYVSRIYDESMNRPPYIIDETLNFSE